MRIINPLIRSVETENCIAQKNEMISFYETTISTAIEYNKLFFTLLKKIIEKTVSMTFAVKMEHLYLY